MKNIQEIRENNIRESSIKQFRGRNWHCTNPVDTMTSLQRRCDVAIQRRRDVDIYLQWKCQTTLQKRRRCNVTLRDVIMRRCKDVVFVTSSDVSIATIWQLQSDVG